MIESTISFPNFFFSLPSYLPSSFKSVIISFVFYFFRTLWECVLHVVLVWTIRVGQLVAWYKSSTKVQYFIKIWLNRSTPGKHASFVFDSSSKSIKANNKTMTKEPSLFIQITGDLNKDSKNHCKWKTQTILQNHDLYPKSLFAGNQN